MSSMTDPEFLNYCDAHAETPRCGFVPSQLSRLLQLAGDAEGADFWASEPNAVHDCDRYWIREQVQLARSSIAAKP